MKNRLVLGLIFTGAAILFCVESKNLDPYKVLGVERSASQRDIQKAFHKLSLQYHPDKNKNKGAQEKFSEINNAYDILSDEQKRKNYDLYGDEKGKQQFEAGDTGQHGGYSYFTGGSPGQGGFSFRPGDWKNMGVEGGSQSFSFSFGGPGSSNGFVFNDFFSNLFGRGMGEGSQFGGFGSSGSWSQFGSRRSAKSLPSVNSQMYRKEIVDGGMSWLLLFYLTNSQGLQDYESVVDEASSTLKGALRVGSTNCESEASFCKEIGVNPRRRPRIFVSSYASNEKCSLVEYDGDLDVKALKSFCLENLPRFSKHVNLDKVNLASDAGRLPKVLLLSSKKNTPVIWRALSGLYHKRFAFFDTEVHDVMDPSAKRLGVDSLPAIVGWLPNGEMQVLKQGIVVKDLKSAIEELSLVLEAFEKTSSKAAEDKGLPLLTASNFDYICGDKATVCLIGVFRSWKTREKLNNVLHSVSEKSFSRRRSLDSGSRDSISYALLDGSKQQSFLSALDKSGFKSSDTLLLAYKPKRGTYAAFKGGVSVTEEEAERFIASVLNGDVTFTKARQKKPSLK